MGRAVLDGLEFGKKIKAPLVRKYLQKAVIKRKKQVEDVCQFGFLIH